MPYDQTVPGGVYEVDGQFRNATNQPVDALTASRAQDDAERQHTAAVAYDRQRALIAVGLVPPNVDPADVAAMLNSTPLVPAGPQAGDPALGDPNAQDAPSTPPEASAPAAPEAEAPSAPDAPAVPDAPEALPFDPSTMTVADLVDALDGVTDAAQVRALQAAEVAGKDRSGAADAFDARLAALSAEG